MGNAVRCYDTGDEIIFKGRKAGLHRVLLENDQVTADIGACLVAEHAVRKTDSRHEVRTGQHLTTDSLVGGAVSDTTRGNEGDKAALTGHVNGLQEEIVMDSAGRGAPDRVIAVGIVGIKDLYISEGDITGHKVEGVLTVIFDGLKTVNGDIHFRMQAFQDHACQQVLLKGHGFHTLVIPSERLAETAKACAGIKHLPDLDTGILQGCTDTINDLIRGVERSEDRVLHALNELLELLLIPGSLTDHGIQLTGLLIIRPVGTVPGFDDLDIGSFDINIVEDELQTTKAAVFSQYILLLVSSLTVLVP